MIPFNNLGYPLRLCHEKGNLGSGFLFRTINDELFLVTASHVLVNNQNQKFHSNEIIINGPKYIKDQGLVDQISVDLNQIKIDEKYFYNPVLDIIALKLGHIKIREDGNVEMKQENCEWITHSNFVSITTAYEDGNVKKFSELTVAMNLIQYGFPTSIGIKSKIINHEVPLVRKGSIAALYHDNKTIISDCEAIYGNSGGPICVEINEFSGENKFYLIGIVIEFVPYVEVFTNLRNNLSHEYILNSGYSIVRSIDDIIDLIKGNTPNTKLQ